MSPPSLQPALTTPPAAVPALRPSVDAISCATSVYRQNNYNVLSGFVDLAQNLNRIRQIAEQIPNTLVGNVIIIGSGPCTILKVLEKSPFSADSPRIDIGPSDIFRDGDVLKVEIQVPRNARYLEAFYLQTDGNVLHLTHPAGTLLDPARQTLIYGDGKMGVASLRSGSLLVRKPSSLSHQISRFSARTCRRHCPARIFWLLFAERFPRKLPRRDRIILWRQLQSFYPYNPGDLWLAEHCSKYLVLPPARCRGRYRTGPRCANLHLSRLTASPRTNWCAPLIPNADPKSFAAVVVV